MKEFESIRNSAAQHIAFIENNASDPECESVKNAIADVDRFVSAVDYAEAQLAAMAAAAQGKAPEAEIEKKISVKAESIANMMKNWSVRGYAEAVEMASKMFKVQF